MNTIVLEEPGKLSSAHRFRMAMVLFFALSLFLCTQWSGAMRAQATAIDFARDIQPILQTHCVQCHGASKAMSQLRLDNKAAAARVITPGKSKDSRLLQRVLGEGGEAQMPRRARSSCSNAARMMRPARKSRATCWRR
jgi:mono/diheme cytochrome c family protein